MSTFHTQLHAHLAQAFEAAHAMALPTRGWALCPRPDMGDLTHAGALLAAKALGQSPQALARAWCAALPAHPWLEQVQVVGPGHLNLRLSPAGWAAALAESAKPFEAAPAQPATLVEFVSANPTGPLHLGHARQAVLGDVLAKLLTTLGGKVGTEFFYNDAGAQIDNLERSVALRVQQLHGATLVYERYATQPAPQWVLAPGEHLFPKDGYHGDYVREIAQGYLAHQAHVGLGAATPLRTFAIEAMQAEQRADLAALGVQFDSWVSEQSLFTSGKVDAVLTAWEPHLYQAVQGRGEPPRAAGEAAAPQAPATWLKTMEHGDDKDRVVLKADGRPTYFVPDVAYHLDKHARGWARAINLQGSDHHGTLARVQAGVQLACPAIGPGYPQAIFHTMIKVMKDGQPVQASKRAGDYLTAREVVEQMGLDAFRMAMLDKKPEAPMVLDIDAWLAPHAANPIYSVQYAHARLCVALDKVAQAADGPDTQAPMVAAERLLAAQVVMLPTRLQQAALDTDPVRVATLAKEIAQAVHGAYQKGPRMIELGGEARASRVRLFEVARQGLGQLGDLLGVQLPARMPERAPVQEATVSPRRPACG